MVLKAPAKLKNWIQSPPWFWAFVISVAVGLSAYLLNWTIAEVHPYTAWGMSYGIAAAVLMTGVALYGLRRRTKKISSKYRLGTSQTWLQFHLYGGALFLLLVFMHTGFRVPSGILTWWLWFLSLWITLSGFLGVLLQKWIPKILASGLAIEVLYERIPALVGEIREKAENLIQTCGDTIQEFYQTHLAAALAAPQPRLIYYADITGGIHARTKQFDYLRRFLPAGEKAKLDQLEAIYKTKLELDAHYTLQKALRWWLYLHLPVSLVLFVLLGLHLYAVLYY